MRIDLKAEAGRPANPIVDQIRREVERRKPGSIDEMNAIAAEVSGRHNRTAQSDLGGVSPEQAHRLIRPGWMDDVIELNDKLSAQDLAAVSLFQNAIRLLQALRELAVVKATASGAFNRKFVLRMFEEFDLSAIARGVIQQRIKALNQDDLPPLRILRHLLPMAGLVLYRNGEFRLTKQGANLLADTAAGQLYVQIFRTFFLKLNLGALDGLPQADVVQTSIGYAFYQISQLAEGWSDVGDIAPKLFLPAFRESLPTCSRLESPARRYAELRILRHLKEFGLVDLEPDRLLTGPTRTRKSVLFDRFIRFNLPPLLGG